MNPEHRIIMAGTVGRGAAAMAWTTAPEPEIELGHRTARQTRRAYGCKPDKPKSGSLERMLRNKGRR